MKDCDELIEELREHCLCITDGCNCGNCEGLLADKAYCRLQIELHKQAADAIERLAEEQHNCEECINTSNEILNKFAIEIQKLKRERDAAIADLDMAVNGQETYPCRYCKNNREGCHCWNEDEGYANWEWRGVNSE